MQFTLQKYSVKQMMGLMGIKDYRTYHHYVDREVIGEPKAGAYSIHQVVLIATHYDYLFTEPFDLTELTVKYSKHLQTVSNFKNLLYPPVNIAI